MHIHLFQIQSDNNRAYIILGHERCQLILNKKLIRETQNNIDVWTNKTCKAASLMLKLTSRIHEFWMVTFCTVKSLHQGSL
jgi:hypothetical protein